MMVYADTDRLILSPQEGANLILEDIKRDKKKLDIVKQEYYSYGTYKRNEFTIGNRVLARCYGIRLEGTLLAIANSFKENLFKPLRFDVRPITIDDIPSDATMIAYLGKLITEYVELFF